MDRGQLAGKRIVVTRRLEQADALCDQLIARGAVPILFPTIQLASLPTPNLDAILPTISQYDWLLFTSVNAVTFFFERVRSLQITPQLPSIGVSGKATANRLRQYHYEPEFMPTKFVGEALVEGLADFVAKECHSSLSGQQVLLPRAKAGRPIVVELLRQQGAIVHEFALYNTVPARPTSSALAALQQGIDVICQKPLAPTYAESEQIVETMQSAGVRFMVHENFRWQPWYREIKRLIEEDVLGEITSLYFRFRTGDGWGEDAYLSRQPFFRKYPRFFVYEAGVHFIDTFRYLLGEIESVYARLRRLNPVIQGEDCVHITFGFESGATAIFDGNRYNESEAVNTRFTFGEMRLDGSKGHLTLDTTGALHIKPLGQPTYEHSYPHPDQGFAGDCCYFLQRHFVESVLGDQPFEQEAADYLKTIAIVEQIYEQAKWQR